MNLRPSARQAFSLSLEIFMSFRLWICRVLKRKLKRRSGIHIAAQKLREWFCCEMGSLDVNDRYIDAFCGRTPKSVLARHYTDYNPDRLQRICERANLKVLV